MIGRMQDMVTAAVVVSAADNKGSRYTTGTSRADNSTGNQQGDDSPAVKSASQPDVPDAITATDDVDNGSSDQQNSEEQEGNPLAPEFVSEMTKELNDLMSKLNCDLEFKYHQEVGVMSVQMIDKKTKEVIKEYPPEDMVKGMIKAKDWLGAFLDKKV